MIASQYTTEQKLQINTTLQVNKILHKHNVLTSSNGALWTED